MALSTDSGNSSTTANANSAAGSVDQGNGTSLVESSRSLVANLTLDFDKDIELFVGMASSKFDTLPVNKEYEVSG